MGKPAVTPEVLDKPWLTAAIIIGLTFVVTFNLFAQTVQRFGVVAGSIFQKMSLIAPTIAAIIYYGDSASFIKILGIILAITSIFVISLSKADRSKNPEKINPILWLFPIFTFIGSCMVDGGLFYVNQSGLASSLDIDFIATLFFFAGCFGVLFVIFDYFKNGTIFRLKDVVAGFALGIPNFFSIYFLLKVLSSGLEGSVVFPINNVSILALTALLGLIFFEEKFNLQKILGFGMAIAAIVLIAIA